MDLPIINNLKQKRRKEIAQGQDLVVREIYNNPQKVVLHGGTAIWRCYEGNRFSQDLDFYFPPGLRSSLEELEHNLQETGVEVEKLKITRNSLYATLRYKERPIKFGGLFKKISKDITKQYKLVDGSSLVVNTLSPVDLLKEKVDAYLDRRKVRDLYDIYYLSGLVKEKEEIKELLSEFLERYQKPKNSYQLDSLIITGATPNTEDMLKELKRWVK